MIELGKKYQTRDGRAVRILCVDRKAYSNESVMALVSEKGGENIYAFHSDGHFYSLGDSPLDLIPAPTKHEGWMIVNAWGQPIGGDIYTSEQAAKQDKYDGVSGCHCVRVTWED